MYGDFIITSLSQRSPSYEELFLHSGHAQLKQKQKHQRSRGVVIVHVILFLHVTVPLHTAAEPAVRAAVKT